VSQAAARAPSIHAAPTDRAQKCPGCPQCPGPALSSPHVAAASLHLLLARSHFPLLSPPRPFASPGSWCSWDFVCPLGPFPAHLAERSVLGCLALHVATGSANDDGLPGSTQRLGRASTFAGALGSSRPCRLQVARVALGRRCVGVSFGFSRPICATVCALPLQGGGGPLRGICQWDHMTIIMPPSVMPYYSFSLSSVKLNAGCALLWWRRIVLFMSGENDKRSQSCNSSGAEQSVWPSLLRR
jgi:hypothetical protein